jgi:hypothetical protein
MTPTVKRTAMNMAPQILPARERRIEPIIKLRKRILLK